MNCRVRAIWVWCSCTSRSKLFFRVVTLIWEDLWQLKRKWAQAVLEVHGGRWIEVALGCDYERCEGEHKVEKEEDWRWEETWSWVKKGVVKMGKKKVCLSAKTSPRIKGGTEWLTIDDRWVPLEPQHWALTTGWLVVVVVVSTFDCGCEQCHQSTGKFPSLGYLPKVSPIAWRQMHQCFQWKITVK